MPYTAKLSSKFYERFGDDVVTELVELLNQVDTASHDRLKELNELNFARFEAKVDARFAQMRADLDARFAQERAHLDASLSAAKDSTNRWQIGLFVTQMLTFVGLWLTRS